jgi:glycosyltransferase involved in cell wall biosynthesis
VRILHVIESLEFGGAEKIVIGLANGMAAAHEVAVCCVKTVGALGPELDPRIRVFSLGKGEGNAPGLPLRLARAIRRERYDVVHTHNWGVFLEGTLAAILAGVPVRVHTVHGPYTAYGASALERAKRGLRHFLERRAARHVRRIAAVSDRIREYITGEIGVDPAAVVTLHNGIPVEGPAPAPRRGEGPAVFITVGRLAAIKNHDLMLRAFHRALQAGARARLVVVGDGPERGAIERYVSDHGLGDRVELVGFRSDVGALLAGADAFLLTSRYEGISVALLEAMRAGLPVIATNVGGIPETVRDGETGILVGPEDLEGAARAIAELAASAERRRELGRRGLEFLREEFSAARMTQRYLDLYAPIPA